MKSHLAALAALFCLALPSAACASGLIDNVNGLTTDSDGRVVRFTGLLLDSEGRVEKRLTDSDKRPKILDFRLDGKGQTLIPGFVDAHADVMRLAIAMLSLDLSGATSTEDVGAKVAAFAAEGRQWVLGFGWDGAGWSGPAPSAAMLDRVAPGTPVWLVDASGEQGWANSAALKLAGITATTPQPAGGRIVMAAGKPSGLLIGRAMELVEKVVPRPAPKDMDAAFLKAQAAFLARGITAVGDMATDIADWQTWRRAGDRDALRIRIVAYTGSTEELPLIAGPQPTPWLYRGRLRLAGVHFALDGGLDSRRAWLSAPYADAPTTSGEALLADITLRNRMSRAAMDGFQIILDATGDRAVKEAAAAISEMGETYKARLRWRIDGADLGAATDLPPLLGDGVSVTVRPAALADGGALARARTGAMADRAYAWKDFVNQRALVAFSGRGPFSPLAPFDAMRIAMTRNGARPDQALSFGEALRAVTAGGAAALGGDGRFGSLAPGDYADFLLIDRDIERSQPEDIGKTRIVETWIAGQKIILEAKQ